jgi:Ser/Thr protein kinase RdoA (MazF antagonist)
VTATDTLLTVPPPRITPAALAAVLRNHWGLSGTLSPLTSERDLNHRLDSPQGRFVIRLTNPAEPAAMTDFQTRAALHVAQRDPDLPVQRLVPLRDGRPLLPLPEGRLRVFTWLEGQPLHLAPRSHAQRRAIGAGLARLTAALADFDHPAADHVLLWDIRQMPALAPLTDHIADPALRADCAAFIADYTARVLPVLNAMPRQVVHADFNPHNLLVAQDNPDLLTGILDFGDMVRTPRACDLAVAASYQIDPADPLGSLSALISGYAAHLPLTPQETALLYDLITARMVTTLTITAWRAAIHPENAPYILRNAPSARAGLVAFRVLGRDAVTHALKKAQT